MGIIRLTSSGYYDVTDTPESLFRMGVSEPWSSTRSGVRYSCGMVRRDGLVRVFVKPKRVIARDTRYRRAMDMVISGGKLPNFTPRGATRPKRGA